MTPPIPGPEQGLNSAVAAELRAEQGRQRLSVAELAERADIPYGSLRRYLNAERHIDLAVLSSICLALDVDVAEVLTVASARLAAASKSNPGDVILLPAKGARTVRATEPPADVDVMITGSGAVGSADDPFSMEGSDIAARDEDRETPRID